MTNQEKKRPVSSARRRYERGKASNYFKTIDDLNPGDLVIVIYRVSHDNQADNGNLADQLVNLVQEVRAVGAKVIGHFDHIGSGKDPSWLIKAVAKAKKEGAILLGESVDRFIRSLYYHNINNPGAQAREEDLMLLKSYTDGVTLMTYIDPDALPSEVFSKQRKRGQKHKGNKGGHPRGKTKKSGKYNNWTEEVKDQARKMREKGASYCNIGKRFNAKRSTIQYWVKDVKTTVRIS